MSKAVAKAQSTAVANAEAFEAYAGVGTDFGANDVTIPRIGVLNALSEELKKNSAKHIDGAAPGDLVDSGLGEILAKQGEKFAFVPVARVREVIVWKPRQRGGGIVSRDPLVGTMEDWTANNGFKLSSEKYEYKDDEGNEAIETWQYYGLVVNNADVYPAFLPMKKSNIKIAKGWNMKMSKIKLPSGSTAPMFYSSWLIGSFLDSGNNNEWWNFSVEKGPNVFELDNASEIFEASVSLREIIEAGNFNAELEPEGVDTDDRI